MYSLKLALSHVHPDPYQLITVTSNVLMTYYVDNFYGLYDRLKKFTCIYNFLSPIEVSKLAM